MKKSLILSLIAISSMAFYLGFQRPNYDIPKPQKEEKVVQEVKKEEKSVQKETPKPIEMKKLLPSNIKVTFDENYGSYIDLTFDENISTYDIGYYIKLENQSYDAYTQSDGKTIRLTSNFEFNKEYKLKLTKGFKTSASEVKDEFIELSFFSKQEIFSLTQSDLSIGTSQIDSKSLSILVDFLGPIKTKKIRDYLIFDDKKVEYSYKTNDKTLEIVGDFKPNQTYDFTLKKGFSAGRYEVKDDLKLSTTFGDLNKYLKFPNNKKYISSYTQAVEFESTNIDSVKVDILKVNKSNLNYVAIFNDWSLRDKYYQDLYNFERFGKIIDTFEQKIENKNNELITTQIDLTDKIKYQEDGIYLVKITNNETGFTDSKVIIKSDIGISAKVSKNQAFFFVNSLNNNVAIKNAEISLFDNKNSLIFKGLTDEFGVLSKNYENIIKANPKMVFVKKDNSFNFINLENPISSYDILNDYGISEKSDYSGFIFMERTLVRPSDNAHILVTVKDENLKSLANKEVELQFIDPSENELFTQKLKLNEVGIAQYNFKSLNNYKTGIYRINLFLGKTKIGYKEFSVETFIPENIDVKLKSDKENYALNEKVDFEISSKYLFGNPAKDLKYDVEIASSEEPFSSKNFKDFTFYNQLNNEQNLVLENINFSGTLNKNGKDNQTFELKPNKTSNPLINTTIIGTVYDDGRAVRRYLDLNIFPYDNIVGIKLNAQEFETNKPVDINTILLNPIIDKKLDSNKEFEIKIFKKYWHYYAGEEIREIEKIKHKIGEVAKFIPTQSGEYYALIENENGQTSSVSFYVSGWDYGPVNLQDKKSYKIDVKTPNNSYKRDEEFDVDLKSPIQGKLLITMEENFVKYHQVIDMKTNNAHIKLKVPNNISQGFYLKAYLVRTTQVGDAIFPYRVIGEKYIKINNDEKKIEAKINIKDLYKSNEKVEVQLESNGTKNGYAVVSLVDKGILNIVDEKPVNGFSFFDKAIEDLVSTYDLYSDLLATIKLNTLSMSGDGIENRKNQYAPVDSINERVKPLSMWSEIVKLDEEGKAKVEFILPQFNGQVQVQTLIVNDNQIGSTAKNFIVKDNVVLKTTLPRFFIATDKASIPLRIINTTDKKGNIELDINSSENIKIINPKITLSLEPKENKVVDINLEALKTGLSKITINATFNNEKFTKIDNIYVKDNYDYKVESFSGVINQNENKKILLSTSKENLVNKDLKTFVTISNSPFSKISKSVRDLIEYPHGCTEQTSSKILAMLLSENFIDTKDTKLLLERKKFINDGIYKLASMQNNEGFFTYWQGGDYVNHYASSFALFALQLAQEKGFKVPQNVIDKAIKAQSSYYLSNLSALPDLFRTSVDETLANKLYDSNIFNDTLTSYLSLGVAMSNYNSKEASKYLLDIAKEKLKNYDYNRSRSYSEDFYSPIKDIASSLYLYSSNIGNDDFTKEMFDIVIRYVNANELYSTQDMVFSMLAIDSYLQNFDVSQNSVDIDVNYDNNKLNLKQNSYKELIVNNNLLELSNKGNLLNYVIDVKKPYVLEVNKDEDKKDKPIFITTTLFDQISGLEKSYEDIKLGDKLILEVIIQSSNYVDNVAVNVQIPAGLEILNPRLYKIDENKFANTNYSPNSEDYRDDRFLTYISTSNSQTIINLPLIATTKGEFSVPACYIEAMYDNRLNDYFKPNKVIIVK